MSTARALSWLPVLLGGCLASGVAMYLQNVLRDVWQIRTLPERVMEWLLLFVPLDIFETGVQRLGGDAKEVALEGAVIGMAAGLAIIGVVALRSRWPGWWLLSLGVGLWLFAMVVVMPVTGAGVFGSGLLISPLLTSAGYLVVFLAFATVLLAARQVLAPRYRDRQRQALMNERRALLAGAFGTLLAGGLARFAGRDGGLVASSLPLATVPTRQIASATPQPASAPTPQIDGQTPVLPAATAAPVPTPGSTPEPLPNPPLPRRLARDQDGSLTAAGRPRGELATPITANGDFYVVTKNAVADPVVDAESWRLIVDGEVNQPVQIDYRTLGALPVVEVTKTMECISNFTAGCSLTSYGCDLISTAQWRGVRLSDVLGLAGGLKSTAVGLAFVATDEFSAGLPVDIVDDPDTLIVFQMNGQPLPREHGFPARLLVPGRYGMKNPKWLASIRAMTQDYQGWYEQRNWNKDGIVKTMARIDLPLDGATLPGGQQRVAGIAYAGDRGLKQIDISADDGGSWQTMKLIEPMPGRDAMVRWEGTFVVPASGSVTLTVRATDGMGVAQVDDFQLPQPDGASGRDQVTVTAA